MHPVVCPVLIGRDDELASLLACVDSASQGNGSMQVVTGEAGVGKSRLVRELTSRALERHVTVLTGRSVPAAVPLPYRPLAEALLGAMRGTGPLDAPELEAFRPALGRLVPEWLPAEPDARPASALVLAEGLLRLLQHLGGERGCLLVLEDLQWADPESLAVLEYLADQVADLPVACVTTIRSDRTSAGSEVVTTLAARRAVGSVELSRLTHLDAVRLASECLGSSRLPGAVEDYLGLADGLPFLIEELLAGLLGAGELVKAGDEWHACGRLDTRVPPTFADTVTRRLAALPGGVRQLLYAAAVLGRRFEANLLPAITGSTDVEAASALREAITAQLVVEGPDGFRFRHALTREAVIGELVGTERTALSARALVAIERAHPGLPDAWCELASDLAWTSGDSARSASLLLEVGRRAAAAGALDSAQIALERARQRAPDDPAATVPIDIALTDVLALAGQVDRATELGETLLARIDFAAHLPAGVAVADVHLRLARAAAVAGRWSVATRHLSAARELSEHGGARVASVDALASEVALGEGRLPEAAGLADAALRRAEQPGFPQLPARRWRWQVVSPASAT